MRLYGITDEYIRFIGKNFPRVYSNKEDERIHIRKYLGTFIEINGFKRKPNTRRLNGLCQTVILNTFLITFNLIDDLHANKLRCLRGF